MRRTPLVLPGALLTVGLVGCGPGAITADRLSAALAPTFTNLYVHQQQQLGHPPTTATALQTTSSCTRGTPATPDEGAGADWSCVVTWLIDGNGTPVIARYDVTVKPDGCYTADGPPLTIGPRTISDITGHDVLNPLFAFDGCFDTT